MPLHHEIENVRISNYSVGGSPSETEPWTAIAMAESGGNTEAHAPHGEDSLGLWQINIDPAQTDNPDTFDCSEIVQWASGTAREGDSGDVLVGAGPGAPGGHVKVFCNYDPIVQMDDGLLLPAVQPAIDNLGIQPPVDAGGGVRSQHTGGVNAVMHDGSVRSDEGPEETVAFDYGKMGGQTFDDLAVDPSNPNTEVDGRDFLVWQRGNSPLETGPAVATETLTIAHEGFWLI